MRPKYNLYCDESLHLERDGSDVMVLGSIGCFEEKKNEIVEGIKLIKEKHGYNRMQEIKWTKVSITNYEFYKQVVDYFFEKDLFFKGLVAHGKKSLDYDWFDYTHDDWYYRMYYLLLNRQIDTPLLEYKVYLDIKDTNSALKIENLKDVIYSANHGKVNIAIQSIRSHESQLIQIADIFIGALGYRARRLSGNKGKVKLIEHIEESMDKKLFNNTMKNEMKFNIFHWKPKVRDEY